MESFSKQMNDIIKKTKDNTRKAVAAGCLEISKEIIQRTPVDTGRLKGNWIPEKNTRPDYSLNTSDKSGSKTISKSKAVTNKLKIGDTYFLVNNLVYAEVVEYGLFPKLVKYSTHQKNMSERDGAIRSYNGYSTQAPQGMVRVTIEEANYLIQKAVKIHGDT